MSVISELNPNTLPAMDRDELNAQEFGVIKVDDAGTILIYNQYESHLASVQPSFAEGKNFFTQVAPCTNNRLVYGRFKEGIAADSLDVELSYTLTYKMRPTNVHMRLYRDPATKTNWVLVKKR